jgi:hypothetical protein
MQKVWSVTKSDGFSVVEVLLAVTMFGMLVAALAGALLYGQLSMAQTGDRSRALALADEGVEAIRSIRDGSYGNLTDGTYGLAQSGSQWILSGSSDTTNIYTRQVTVASSGTSRKSITSTVSWPSGGSTRQVSTTTRLTNWMATIIRTWANPVQRGTLDASGANDGIKVATQGNYAYVVRNDGTPDFLIINISDPLNPTLVGSLSLAGVPTNIAVSGNYAYVTNTSDTAELQIINVTTPSSPSLIYSYNAAGAADGAGIYVSGNYAYLVRKANAANNEFVALNIATPTLPVRVGWYNLNVNMNEVYVNGGNVFIATDSDTQEILELSSVLLGLVTIVTSINLPGTANATTIDGFDNTLLVGQGTTFYTVDGGLTNSVTGSTTLSGTINDIAFNTARTYAFVGTTAPTAEFQVVSIGTLSAPAFVKGVDVAGATTTINGVSYNAGLDVAPSVGDSDTQELTVFGPG